MSCASVDHLYAVLNPLRASFIAFCLAICVVIPVSPAGAADARTSKDDAVERAIRLLSDAPSRILGNAVRLCASREAAGSDLIAGAFERYLVNFALGVRAGLAEVKATEWIAGDQAPYSTEAIAIQTRQGEMLAQSIQAAPTEGCKRLSENLSSGSETFFKDFLIQSYREYQEKRRVFCSQAPRPANCKPDE